MKGLIALIILIGVVILGMYLFSSDEVTTEETVQTEEVASETMEQEESGDAMEAMVDVSTETTDVEVSTEAGITETIEIDGFNFGYSLDEIRVKEGTTVTINLTSSDGFHDWVVDEFGAATEKIQTGGTASVTFVADKAGTYEYYCSVGQHRANGMVGTLIVE